MSETVREDQGYYYGLIGSRIRAFEWYPDQRPYITLDGVLGDCSRFLHTRYYLRNWKSYGLPVWPVHSKGPSEQKATSLTDRQRDRRTDIRHAKG